MKSTCVLIIVCAMNVSFSRFNNPPLGGFFCGCVGCFSVGALVRGVVGILCFLWSCGGFMFFVGLWGFMFFVGLWGCGGFIEDYQFMGDLWWDLR